MMVGGKKVTDPNILAQHCENFMNGAKKQYDEGPGDMWLFELYYHLKDCADALRKCT
jgi:hypothetical protein